MRIVTRSAKNWAEVEKLTNKLRDQLTFGRETEERWEDEKLLGVDVTFNFSTKDEAEEALQILE